MRGRRAIPTTKERLPDETDAQWTARMDRLAIQQHRFNRSHSDNLRRLQENERDRATVPKP
jgi:hypothetical protein